MPHGRAVPRVLLALLVAIPLLGAARAEARPARPPVPTEPAPGWLVDRVRFEPLDPGVALSAPGVGDYHGAYDVSRPAAPEAGGPLAVVNEVGFEDYVRGLSEVPSTWPAEALKAQAVAARTYALHELANDGPTRARAVGAQICATDSCQVYAGLAKERGEGGDNWVAAVTQTAGQILLYRGEPIVAKYSSSNGGASVSGGEPYLRAVPDPDDTYSPLHHWRVGFPLADVAGALAVPGAITSASRTGDVITLGWTAPANPPPTNPSPANPTPANPGPATAMASDPNQPTPPPTQPPPPPPPPATGQVTIPAPDFAAKLNAALSAPAGVPRPVPSLRFGIGVDATAQTVVLDGGGWGHGIGLNQWGAFGKALRGMQAADILAAYYAGLRPVPAPAEQLPHTIRVAVDTGRPAVDVTSTANQGSFRVLDQSGQPLATVATGLWHVVPDGTRMRVVPPADQREAPAVQLVGADDAAGQAQIRLSAPALVTVALHGATGAPRATATPVPLLAGDAQVAIPIPVGTTPGRYLVAVTADAGAGRTASATLAFDVRAGARSLVLANAASRAGAGPGDGSPIPSIPGPFLVAVALAGLVGALVTGVRATRAGRSRRAGTAA